MKRRLFALFHRLGVTRFLAWWHRGEVMILCYHGVSGGETPVPGDTFGLHVRKSRFVAQLEWLTKRYEVVSLRRVLDALDGRGALPKYALALTFDDGFRNFLTVAAPLLRDRKLEASQFVVTDWVNRRNGAPVPAQWTPSDEELSLSWDEVASIHDARFEVGSHTCSHRSLAEIPAGDMDRELRESLAQVRRVASPPVALAYPKGSYNDQVAERARELGYSCGLTTDGGFNSLQQDRFRLRRTLVGDHDDEATFAARLSGLALIGSRLQHAIRRALAGSR